jgi:hypothetical protein
MADSKTNAERTRLAEARNKQKAWKKWGPYLSERQWGTVREDYSEGGTAWDYFSHDQARSRAYRWGEDGLGGISDEKQRLCFALAFWNGKDPILKERLFGLTNSEGNHGEDVKEYYFYLDSTPTHSYMKYLYKYPQAAYPYDKIVATNRKRSRTEREYELMDTGVFDDDRYFDVFLEVAKKGPEDILLKVTVCNRGEEAATLHLLPHLWFRNTWSWTPHAVKPVLQASDELRGMAAVVAEHNDLGRMQLSFDQDVPLLFTENETNTERIFGQANETPFVKDAFHNYLVGGHKDAVNPEQTGTKMAAHYELTVPAKGEVVVRMRLAPAVETIPGVQAVEKVAPFDADYEATVTARRKEADEFYGEIVPDTASEDEARIIRQALSGMLWSKQYYYFDLDRWLEDHGHAPLRGKYKPGVRNANWFHMVNDDVISMPDKWEYPWYAAWDLAFHTIALDAVDPDFAKEQLSLVLKEVYLHPNGQLPAYEWNFGDVNPPVHAFAALYAYNVDKFSRGKGDLSFLKNIFQKLLLNFSWWANRKDPQGRNLFEGGFLGLDNIGVFDRSAPLPTGGYMEQADGTAWMALFCQNMLEIALELAMEEPAYEELAMKFVEHFFWIAGSMDRIGVNLDELWDEEDGFFYDLLHLPDGSAKRLKVRSMVGLLPMCAATVIPEEYLARFPGLERRTGDFLRRRPELVTNIHPPSRPGFKGRRLLAVCGQDKLRRILARMLDENRFLSPFGIRSISRWHAEHPYEFDVHGDKYIVQYQPAESQTGLFGGNSNWRGPVWYPINVLIIRALLQYWAYYGEAFKVECPTGSGNMMNLWQVVQELSQRLSRVFLREPIGRRPVYGDTMKFQTDPHWRDLILFYEYFHGDNGAGIGASHQTGWTGMVSRLIQLYHLNGNEVLAGMQAGLHGTDELIASEKKA